MSKCHFPQDNFTIILDFPSIKHIQLRLIETNQRLPDPSLLSLNNIEHPHSSAYLLQDQDDQDSLGLTLQDLVEEEDTAQRISKKKTGCTCKKTNCIKMYCECFSVGKLCTPECACYGCHNHSEQEGVVEKAKLRSLSSNRHHTRGCNCKKTNCLKKYCECFNAGLPCTELCNCNDCHNKHEDSADSSLEGDN